MPEEKTTEEKIEEFRPFIEKLIHKTGDLDAGFRTFVAGFVFLGKDGEPAGLIKFGNIENTGKFFITNVTKLSNLADAIDAGRLAIEDFSIVDISAGKSGESTEQLADDLATKVLSAAGEPRYASNLMDLAQRYFQSKGKNNV